MGGARGGLGVGSGGGSCGLEAADVVYFGLEELEESLAFVWCEVLLSCGARSELMVENRVLGLLEPE